MVKRVNMTRKPMKVAMLIVHQDEKLWPWLIMTLKKPKVHQPYRKINAYRLTYFAHNMMLLKK